MGHRMNVSVPAQTKSYDLIVGHGVRTETEKLSVVSKASGVFAIVDSGVPAHLVEPFLKKIALGKRVEALRVPSGESSKSMGGLGEVWRFLSSNQADRQSVVLNIGGGIVGDLGGFAASTYMRGIPFVQIPTTLLAQVDASIGGKLAINFDDVKNLVGSITPPEAVIIDLDFLPSLSEREFRSGFAEIVKHGLIKDLDYAKLLFSKDAKGWSPQELEQIVIRSCEIKRAVVESDPYEVGLRKVLNFGHTVGHALESLSHKSTAPLKHGEAVFIGMLVEASIAMRAGILPREEFDFVYNGLQRTGILSLNAVRFPLQDVKALMLRDKKNRDSKIKFSLLSAVGTAVFDQVVPMATVDTCLEEYCCGK